MQIALLLSKLAINYYRPDFTEGQAKQLISTMVSDLEEFPVPEVDRAITLYRRQPAAPGKQKYFPDVSVLRNIIIVGQRERAALERDQKGKPKVEQESRPLMWWCHPKERWKPHWREDDIQAAQREQYNIIKAKRIAAQ